MKVLIRKLQAEWPAWLVISWFALLPIRRASEVPLLIFALLMPYLAFSSVHKQRTRQVCVVLIPLFLCFWLPMLLSSLDSYDPGKSWSQSLTAVRYLMAAISIAILLHPRSLRWKVMGWTAFILFFWAADGFFQLFFGFDLFGVPLHEDRLNGLFLKKYQYYGPLMAMLSPILLEYARRRWSGAAWAAAFALVMGAVLISGMRSGWVVMGLVMAVYAVLMFRRENRELRRVTMTIPAITIIVIAVSYMASPLFQQRVSTTLAVTNGTEQALDKASSLRVPIFTNAIRMYRAHPINGVGVRAFPLAYLEFADPDDPHVMGFNGLSGARHAHNIVLEVAADTGTIGLLALLLALILAVRHWRAMTPFERQETLPFALPLALVLFPLNTHFAIYGTTISSLIWVLAGLCASVISTTDQRH